MYVFDSGLAIVTAIFYAALRSSAAMLLISTDCLNTNNLFNLSAVFVSCIQQHRGSMYARERLIYIYIYIYMYAGIS